MGKHSKKKNGKKIAAYVSSAVAVVITLALVIVLTFPGRSEDEQGKKTSSPKSLSPETSSEPSSAKIAPEEPPLKIDPEEPYVEPDPNVTMPDVEEIEITEDTTISDLKEQVQTVKPNSNNTVVVKETGIDSSKLTQRSVRLGVDFLAQNPELPTGCEITSLTTVLNYLGYDVSKVEMADNYLEKSSVVPSNFWKVFLGDPKSKSGFGCYAQPITDAANKYLTEQNSDYVAYNMSGTKFEDLLSEVEAGRPVVIWGTMSMKAPYTTYKWNVDGVSIQWIAPEHCLVLIGYDIDRNVAIMSDPQKGIVEYNLETVKSRYEALYSQCVVLKLTEPEPEPTPEPDPGENEGNTDEDAPDVGEPPEEGPDENKTEDNASDNEDVTISPEKTEGSESHKTEPPEENKT